MSNEFPFKVDILYEDDHCAAINKPAGLMVHADGRSSGPFLTDWVVAKYPEAAQVGETMVAPDGQVIFRPGIVHRLDRETSGVLLIAKTAEGHAMLKKQFQERTMRKKYIAFVWGELKEEFGSITKPIGRSGSDFRKWSSQRGARGEMRDAETYWSRIWTGADTDSNQEKYSFIEAEPKTGRTHQIRVHMQAIQHPVVGDNLYAGNKPKKLGFERTALHAGMIEFENMEGKKVQVKAGLPEDFRRACNILHIPLELLRRIC